MKPPDVCDVCKIPRNDAFGFFKFKSEPFDIGPAYINTKYRNEIGFVLCKIHLTMVNNAIENVLQEIQKQ